MEHRHGGKMVSSASADNPDSDFYYIYYYDEFDKVTALSKLNEKNLKKIASDLKVDYIHMEKMSDIDNTLKSIKQQISSSQATEEKISSYQDIYYYFAIPFVILLMIEFVLKKRRMQ